jgi:CBS domain-containing protein
VSLKVEDVMVKEVITISFRASVKRAAEVMNKYEIGSLIVVKRNKAVGIITERDVLKRVVAKALDPKKTTVEDVMSKPLIVVEPDMDLEDVVKLMFGMKIKKLPVVKSGKLVGLVSMTDIARFEPHMMNLLKKLAAQQMMPKRMEKVVHYYIS